MQERKEWPPNIEKIRSRFPVSDDTVFTYGESCYVPSGRKLDAPLITHEDTHAQRQGNDPDGWWDKYLDDPNFRLLEETLAYARQYKHFCRDRKDRNKQSVFLHYLAGELSGPLYGNLVSSSEARKMILETSG